MNGGILAHEQIHVRTNGDLAQMAKRARQCHQEPTKGTVHRHLLRAALVIFKDLRIVY